MYKDRPLSGTERSEPPASAWEKWVGETAPLSSVWNYRVIETAPLGSAYSKKGRLNFFMEGGTQKELEKL